MTNIVLGGSTPDDGFELKSLRGHVSPGSKLRRTNVVAGNKRLFTYSAWVKIGELRDSGGRYVTFAPHKYASGSSFFLINLYQGTLQVSSYDGGWEINLKTTALFRDPTAWYHFVIIVDTENATSTERVRMYVNGERITAMTDTTYPTQNLDVHLLQDAGVENSLAGQGIDSFDGYLSEAYFIDGYGLSPASFGETNELTNQWQPKNPTDIKSAVTFGTNGWYLPFSNEALATSFEDGCGNATLFAAFTSTGANTWTCPTGVTSAEILVVAGGGNGGYGPAGGGGSAGGVVHNSSYTVVPGVEYDITVGTVANNSVFNVNAEGSGSTMTALAGAAGGRGLYGGQGYDGGSGSGGGGAGTSAAGDATQGDSGGGTGYGNDGGTGATGYKAGGGGGAGAAGGDGGSNSGGGGAG
ncbi:MAG: hypothetical protein QF535_04425, partial [Anaerolineales bacterium]|nr:hypothetical protein [Anaerolineales bacterium]